MPFCIVFQCQDEFDDPLAVDPGAAGILETTIGGDGPGEADETEEDTVEAEFLEDEAADEGEGGGGGMEGGDGGGGRRLKQVYECACVF